MLRHDVVRVFCVVPCVSFCTGHFVMVPLNMTYLHCLQHSLFENLFNLYYSSEFNWENGKPSCSIACMGKQPHRLFCICISVVMKDATPLTPLAHERNSIFKCKQHTIHDPWGSETFIAQWWSMGRHFTRREDILLMGTCVLDYDRFYLNLKSVLYVAHAF